MLEYDMPIPEAKRSKAVEPALPTVQKRMEIHEGKAGVYFQCRPCNVIEKAEEKKKENLDRKNERY